MGETLTPRAVHILPEHRAEIHMIGDYVAVRWNVKPVRQTRAVTDRDGDVQRTTTTTTTRWEREGAPYLSFVTVLVDGDSVWIDEDSPVDGGLSAQAATQVRDELTLALAYLEQLTGG